MHKFHRRCYRYLRYIPRRKNLKGSWLHRLLGDRLFEPEIWRPTRRGVAGGLALGLFIGLSPTMGVQIILSGICAYLLRVNIPVALAACLITNPVTAVLIYPFEYQLGVWLAGVPEPRELESYTGPLRSFARHAKPLMIGSFVAGGMAALMAYALVMLLWPRRDDRGACSVKRTENQKLTEGIAERVESLHLARKDEQSRPS